MIIHIDMDAFYASVEELDNPEIKQQPVIVGGPSKERGVVSAANYKARTFGVHSAMPMSTANRLCPQAIIIRPRHQRYSEISKCIREIFYRYTPLVQPLSLDEAFLDVTASVKLFGSVVEIARRIKNEIKTELNLNASAGIAPNKFLAKLASDADKPDGFVVVKESEVQSFLDPMPVSQLWGVGKSSVKKLEQKAVYTVFDLRQKQLPLLEKLFGELQAQHLWNLARGIDERKVVTDSLTKSISKETTFSQDKHQLTELKRIFLKLTEDVCERMRNEQLCARTIKIKYRRPDFKTFTRSESLASVTNRTDIVWNTVSELIAKHIDKPSLPLRLIGVGLSNFTEQGASQTDLFEPQASPVDELSDEINSKFGKASITRAKGLLKTKPNDS